MTVEPMGDRAYIARQLSAPAWFIADTWRRARLAGVREVVAAYESVAVIVDPEVFEIESLVEPPTEGWPVRPVTEVPVRYDGADLEEVATRLGWTVGQVIESHTRQVYTCYAIGFCPGFPYLGYVEGELATLGRRPEPRVRVPAGSVAIAGKQTGIYPLERPGGWWLLGTADYRVVDLAEGFFAFAPGDRVKFCAI